MKIFLVEDEWLHAEDIRISIENLGYEWVGCSSEGFDAINQIEATSPDVILLDMMLHGALSGIAIAAHIKVKFKKPFIFITSMLDDDIIQNALHTHPVAYLTKPINEGDLKAALLKAKFLIQQDVDEPEVTYTADQLLIRVGKNLKPLNKADIFFIQTAEKNYCKIHAQDKSTYSVKKSLTFLDDLLASQQFFRVHKEYLINLAAVAKIDEAEQIVYIQDQPIPIGSNYKQGLYRHFNIL